MSPLSHKIDMLASAATPRELARQLALEAGRLFRYDVFLLRFYDETRGLLIPIYGEDTLQDSNTPRECHVDPVVHGRLAHEPRLVNRSEEDMGKGGDLQPFGEESRLSRSLMFCPIFWGMRPIGQVSVQSYRPGHYDANALGVLEAFAEQCGPLLARVFHEERHEQLARALDQTSSMLLITDIEGRITFANRSFLDRTGYGLEEVVGRNPRFLKSGRTEKRLYDELWKTISNGREWKGDIVNRCKDGTFYWARMTITPVFDVDGAMSSYLAVQEDVTDRKNMELTLRRRDAIMQAVAFSAEEFLCNADWESSVQRVLEQFRIAADVCRVCLFAVERPTVGKPLLKMRFQSVRGDTDLAGHAPLLDPGGTPVSELGTWGNLLGEGITVQFTRETATAPQLRLLEERGLQGILLLPILYDGSWWGGLSVECSRTPRSWHDAEVAALRAAARIVSASVENVHKEQTIRESEEKTRVLFDTAPWAAVLLDPDSRILALNHVTSDMLGYPHEEMLGRLAYDFLPDDVIPNRREAVERAIRTGETVQIEDSYDGRLFISTIHPILEPGSDRVTCVAIFGQEITSIRRNERLAALGMTASGLAHSIRNIQSALGGSISLLDRGLSEKNTELVESVWPIVRRATNRINRLTMNLLALSREQEDPPEPTDLNAFLREAVEELEGQTCLTGCGIRLDLQEDIPPVALNPSRFFDAIANLVRNASESYQAYDAIGGPIEISTWFDPVRGFIVLEIRDEGAGMDPVTIDHLFEPFFSTKGSKGTGIGMAVVKRILDDHGARIRVESEVGEGTSFLIDLEPLESTQEEG